VLVSSVHKTTDDSNCLRTIRISADSPKSESDFFLLNATRAASDLVVVSGRILREEPLYRSWPVGKYEAELMKWRLESLGKHKLPSTLILTASGDIDASMRVFHCPHANRGQIFVYGPEKTCERLRGQLPQTVSFIPAKSHSIIEAVDVCRHLIKADSCSIETGPSTSLDLLAARKIDTCLLSIYKSSNPTAVAGEFWPWPRLLQNFSAISSLESDESWTFHLLSRL